MGAQFSCGNRFKIQTQTVYVSRCLDWPWHPYHFPLLFHLPQVIWKIIIIWVWIRMDGSKLPDNRIGLNLLAAQDVGVSWAASPRHEKQVMGLIALCLWDSRSLSCYFSTTNMAVFEGKKIIKWNHNQRYNKCRRSSRIWCTTRYLIYLCQKPLLWPIPRSRHQSRNALELNDDLKMPESR